MKCFGSNPGLDINFCDAYILPILFSIFSLNMAATPGSAQDVNLPNCQPPVADEFLLLVVTPTVETKEQLQQALPPSVSVPACNYLGSQVSRMGGFRDIDHANAWSQYITEVVGLPAFVARPPSANSSSASDPIAVAPAIPKFEPKLLGMGYAILVDYFNDPAIATQLQQAQQARPGLASYGQRPYLLADYTTDGNLAVRTLTNLSNQGFQVLLVDSRAVTLLTDQIQQP